MCSFYQDRLGTNIGKAHSKKRDDAFSLGDVHTVVYDHAAMKMYVATARPDGGAGPLPAYQRQFTALDMTKLFSEPAPEAEAV